MDGVGRAFDNIMVEPLWRTVNYEDVYLRDNQTPAEARLGLGRYFAYYNHRRRHRSPDRRTPASAYGLEALPQEVYSVIALPPRGGIIKTGDGRSVAAIAAVAPAALRFASATAAGTLPMQTVLPYLPTGQAGPSPETVPRMGTS